MFLKLKCSFLTSFSYLLIHLVCVSLYTVPSVWMERTMFQNTSFMHPQNRNIHGKIFGGYIMRVNCYHTFFLRFAVKNIDDFIVALPVEFIVWYSCLLGRFWVSMDHCSVSTGREKYDFLVCTRYSVCFGKIFVRLSIFVRFSICVLSCICRCFCVSFVALCAVGVLQFAH